MVHLDPFYPILPDTDWLARLLPAGIKFVQLRIKDQSLDVVRAEIGKALALCKAHGCQLVINDYWREAIDAGATFVHLGQEDLATADRTGIRRAGIKIGVSTHSVEELETALGAEADYVALGPIYATTLKVMPWAPQGLPRIAEWRERIRCPLVAIGGMTVDRAPLALAAGANSVAVLSDLVTSYAPKSRAKNWLAATAPWRDYPQDAPKAKGAPG